MTKFVILIDSYDEAEDNFKCRVFQDQATESFLTTIPAFLMPVIASELCAETEDLPFGLVNQVFEVVQG